jgi:hypothetical protein
MLIQTSTILTNNVCGGPCRKPLRGRDADIIKEIERLREPEQIAYQQRSRFAMRSYLKQVYRLYCRWQQTSDANQNAPRAAALQGMTVRRGPHPLKILIDLTTPPTTPMPRRGAEWHGPWSLGQQKEFDRETSVIFSTSPEVSPEQQDRWYYVNHDEFGVPIGDNENNDLGDLSNHCASNRSAPLLHRRRSAAIECPESPGQNHRP